jgi:alkaline phosphatase
VESIYSTLHYRAVLIIFLLKTFCSDSQVADSACSATAYLCGTKANIGTIGVSPAVLRYDCEAHAKPENHVSSILAWAQVLF